MNGLDERAKLCGASKLYIEDIVDEFCDDYIVPCVQANAVYENKYLLGTSMARPGIAKKLVEIARKEGATAICHGATGKGHLKPDCIVVSIAAGQPIANIKALLGEVRLIRAMPNTPALVGAAMSALCPNDKVTPEEVKLVESLFNSFGRAEVVPESMMDAVVGVSGSSPAYVYMFIEAMADAAVADGMPRAQAYKFAAQSVLGAAKMVLETGKHPGELKDAVCSPGGTTIEAVAALEHGGFRDTVISAQRACSKKSYDMSQK